MNTTKQRVLIVEDHPLFRDGIKLLLGREQTISIAKETGDAKEALAYAKAHRLDLALVDISLNGGMNGIRLTRLLKKAVPKLPVIILTVHTKADLIEQAFGAGALGFVNKESAGDVLIEAIEKVTKGIHYIDTCLSPELARKLKEYARSPGNISDESFSSLTNREQEVLALLAEDMTARQVSDRLELSIKTIENYRSNIYTKLGLSSRTGLLRYCVKIGMSDPDTW